MTRPTTLAALFGNARRRWRRTMAAIGQTGAKLTQLPVPTPGAVASTALTGPVLELADAQLGAVAAAGSMRQADPFGVRTRPDAFGVRGRPDAFGQEPTEPTI